MASADRIIRIVLVNRGDPASTATGRLCRRAEMPVRFGRPLRCHAMPCDPQSAIHVAHTRPRWRRRRFELPCPAVRHTLFSHRVRCHLGRLGTMAGLLGWAGKVASVRPHIRHCHAGEVRHPVLLVRWQEMLAVDIWARSSRAVVAFHHSASVQRASRHHPVDGPDPHTSPPSIILLHPVPATQPADLHT
jgi:hypothetical protein